MRLIALLTVSVLVGATTAAPVPKAKHKVAPSLDGTWQVVEFHSNGVKVNSTVIIKWVVDGQSLSIERTNPKLVGGGLRAPAGVTYTLVKPDGEPANAIDYIIQFADGVTPTRTMPGVFELDGDTLQVCWTNVVSGGKRPAKCEPAESTSLYVLHRVKEEKKDN